MIDFEATDPITELSDFVRLLRDFPNNRWAFRGQSNIHYPLVPSAGRIPYWKDNPPDFDLSRFRRWKDDAIAFCDDLPQRELEQLAYAQHYRLKTRLLDWTTNAIVALYFATEDLQTDVDGVMYAYHYTGTEIDLRKLPTLLPRYNKVMFYHPRLIIRRILAQDGRFTYHPRPNEIFAPRRIAPKYQATLKCSHRLTLVRWSIPFDKKRYIQEDLRDIDDALSRLTRSAY